jgi:hypothetical protein
VRLMLSRPLSFHASGESPSASTRRWQVSLPSGGTQ